jgi:hypothetical protein
VYDANGDYVGQLYSGNIILMGGDGGGALNFNGGSFGSPISTLSYTDTRCSAGPYIVQNATLLPIAAISTDITQYPPPTSAYLPVGQPITITVQSTNTGSGCTAITPVTTTAYAATQLVLSEPAVESFPGYVAYPPPFSFH